MPFYQVRLNLQVVDIIIYIVFFFQFADDDDDYGVYAISSVSFPSHIRKLLPASENHMLEYMALERARRRLRNVIIALAIFAICATLLSVSLVFGFQRKEDDVTTQVRNDAHVFTASTTRVLD